jgi:hypothetical protein
MSISYPCKTVMCYYPYPFGGVAFLVSCAKMLLGILWKAFWVWKVFMTKLKWKTLTLIIYSSVIWGLLFTVWNKEIIQPLIYSACVWGWETQCAFPLHEILWLRLIRLGHATCSELNYVVPGDVTLETTPIPGTCYTYWHGELIISNVWGNIIKRFFSLCILFLSSFCLNSFFCYLKAD